MIPFYASLEALALYVPLLLVPPLFYYSCRVAEKSKALTKWAEYYRDAKVLAPYVWPQDREDTKHALNLLGAISLCVAVGRVVKLASPLLLRQILEKMSATGAHRESFPWQHIVGYILIRYILNEQQSFLQWDLTRRLESQVQDQITVAVYDKLMSLSADYHDSKNSFVCFEIIPDILDSGLGIIAFSSVCGSRLAGITVIVLVGYFTILFHTARSRDDLIERWKNARNQRDDISSDSIWNWWTVALFGRVEFEKNRHARAVDHQASVNTEYCNSFWRDYTSKNSLLSSGLLLLCLLASRDIWDEGRSGEDLVIFLHLWTSLVEPIRHIGDWNDKLKSFSVETRRLMEILNQKPSIIDRENAKDFEYSSGSIRVENTTFVYKEKGTAVKDMSFEVKGGQTLAIVGQSGGGKSSLLKLLTRSYDPTFGKISINSQNIQDVRKATLLQHIAIVPQDIGVFSTTVLENLRYGKFDATLAECEEACRAVGLHDKISKSFDKGYQEELGERGRTLSGGELQRLAIARALVRGSNIVLLDEAMSSLDAETEAGVQEYLRKWTIGRTVIIVSHRLATITHADMILAVKNGNIVERGTHAELLAKKGYFYELWLKQKLA